MSQPSPTSGETVPTEEQKEVMRKALQAVKRFEQLIHTHGITPESTMEAVRRSGGEVAVAAVRRAADEKLLAIESRIEQARVHTPPKTRVTARMMRNSI